MKTDLFNMQVNFQVQTIDELNDLERKQLEEDMFQYLKKYLVFDTDTRPVQIYEVILDTLDLDEEEPVIQNLKRNT